MSQPESHKNGRPHFENARTRRSFVIIVSRIMLAKVDLRISMLQNISKINDDL